MTTTTNMEEHVFQLEVTDIVKKIVGDVSVEVQCPETGYLIDIVHDKVAIEVDGPSHYFGDRLNGATNLKTFLLRRANWNVVRISYQDWNKPGCDHNEIVTKALARKDPESNRFPKA